MEAVRALFRTYAEHLNRGPRREPVIGHKSHRQITGLDIRSVPTSSAVFFCDREVVP